MEGACSIRLRNLKPKTYPAEDEWYFGTPWYHPDVFAQNSPATFIRNARTPTLIVHGEDDRNNPVGQSRALYRALKHNGVECELIVYPGEGHLPAQEKHQIDILQRMLDWYDRHLNQPTNRSAVLLIQPLKCPSKKLGRCHSAGHLASSRQPLPYRIAEGLPVMHSESALCQNQ